MPDYCFSVHQTGSQFWVYKPTCHHSMAVFVRWPLTTDQLCCPSPWAFMAEWDHTAAPSCRHSYFLTICNYEITGDGCVLTVVNLYICSYLFCIVNIKFMFGPFLHEVWHVWNLCRKWRFLFFRWGLVMTTRKIPSIHKSYSWFQCFPSFFWYFFFLFCHVLILKKWTCWDRKPVDRSWSRNRSWL